ncbi:MAG: ABC transporter permease [Bacillota bacterium]|jgi:Uncharacterized ABC-type transport system, permease component
MAWLLSLGDIVHNTLVFSTALILAAVGGVFSERSGVVNIALEGLMIVGAFSGAVTAIFLGEVAGWGDGAPYVALAVAALAGMLFAVLHAVATVTFRADQVVSGVALNFLAFGFTIFMVKLFFDGAAQTTTIQHPLSEWRIPVLSEIPVLGRALFVAYPTTYLAFLVVAVAYYVLWKTPFGLRLRAVGEHPRAADTLGINVQRIRYLAVLISGALAGLGGASVALTTTSNFSHSTIAGQGFIALAAMIFGKWHPVGAMLAALFFGLTQAARTIIQVFGLAKVVPVDLINLLPYVVTILVLAGVVGRAEAPAALGRPYVKGER